LKATGSATIGEPSLTDRPPLFAHRSRRPVVSGTLSSRPFRPLNVGLTGTDSPTNRARFRYRTLNETASEPIRSPLKQVISIG
jgi:hypothetical protein